MALRKGNNGALFEKIADIAARIPDDDLKKIPTDGARNHDKYIGEGKGCEKDDDQRQSRA